MSDFAIRTRKDGDVRTVECTGTLPAGRADKLASAIDSCIEEGAGRLNVNLARYLGPTR